MSNQPSPNGLPPLPEKPVSYSDAPTYSLDDSISTICIVRQQETYTLPILNEASDLFSGGTIDYEAKLKSLQSDGFWGQYVQNGMIELIKSKKLDELENNLVEGIPEDLRALVYLKTLQVKHKMDSSGYSNILKKAINSKSVKNQELFLENLPVDKDLKEVLKIFNYYTNEVIVNTTRLEAINNGSSALDDNTEDLPPNNFVIHISKLVHRLPHLSKEELLSLLLKFNKLFVNLNKDEFFYKTNRSLEDISPEIFNHISKQGINLINFYKKILFNFFNDQIEDEGLLFKIFDFVVIEGFDFIARVLVAVIEKNKTTILSLDGDELNDFLSSKKLFASITNKDLLLVLQVEPQIIRYENEFHLLHANSLNRNHNELTNLKEINDDLVIKINELKQQSNNLRITHTEIVDQSRQYNEQLEKAKLTKQELLRLRDQLEEKLENLTMRENLKNTIAANQEFSARNAELEEQISALKKSIEDKNAKLAK